MYRSSQAKDRCLTKEPHYGKRTDRSRNDVNYWQRNLEDVSEQSTQCRDHASETLRRPHGCRAAIEEPFLHGEDPNVRKSVHCKICRCIHCRRICKKTGMENSLFYRLVNTKEEPTAEPGTGVVEQKALYRKVVKMMTWRQSQRSKLFWKGSADSSHLIIGSGRSQENIYKYGRQMIEPSTVQQLPC